MHYDILDADAGLYITVGDDGTSYAVLASGESFGANSNGLLLGPRSARHAQQNSMVKKRGSTPLRNTNIALNRECLTFYFVLARSYGGFCHIKQSRLSLHNRIWFNYKTDCLSVFNLRVWPKVLRGNVMQLGDLEKQVLKYLWQTSEADAKQVHKVVSQTRHNALNTVQSALERLFKKGILSRRKQGHAYLYQPKVDREGLINQLINNATSDFIEDGENSLIAAFGSVSSNLNDHELDALEQLIEQQRTLRNQEK